MLAKVITFFITICIYSTAYGFDIKGFQPTIPYGIFSTFSAESLPKNKFAFNHTVDRSYKPDFYRNTTHIAFGLTDFVEIGLDISQISGWQDGRSGAEDVIVGMTHRVVDDGKYTPSVAYVINAALDSGKQEFSSQGGYGGGIVFTKKIGPFKGHLNGFYSKPNDTNLRDEYRINAGVDMAVTHHTNILAELETKRNYFNKQYDLMQWRIGLRAQPVELVFATIGAGFDINNRSPDMKLFFAFGLIFPNKKPVYKKIIEE